MKKILLTVGSENSISPNSWADYTNNIIGTELLNVSEKNISNTIIARKTIYNVIKLLEKYSPDEILVGVIWTDITRSERYVENGKNDGYFNLNEKLVSVVDDSKNWRIFDKENNDTSKDSKLYYDIFYNKYFSMISTLEQIIRIQSFFKKYDISYFMTFTNNLFEEKSDFTKLTLKILDHVETAYLIDMIDYGKCLPTFAFNDWCDQNNLEQNTNCHEKFSNEVIIPYLRDKNLI